VSDAAHFSADWLRLREGFDRAAREAAAARLGLRDVFQAMRPPGDQPWRVIDLGCGSGATVRAVSALLPGPQQWLLVDRDAALLERTPSRHGEAECRTWCVDLASELHRLPLAGCTLVTATALLDLVSADWLLALVAACARSRVALYLSLTVDGRWRWQPPHPADALVARAFTAHQQRDKGFGAALGTHAAAAAVRACRAAGYRVRSARSDWRVDGAAPAPAARMQRQLIDGMAAAATQQAHDHAAALDDWRRQRIAVMAETALVVGHVDLIALPPRPSRRRAAAAGPDPTDDRRRD
jgi:hypothetical protein